MKRSHRIIIYTWLVLITLLLVGIVLGLKHLNYNLNVVYYNQQVLNQRDGNSIKIQLPDGYKLDDSETNMVVPDESVYEVR